MGWPCEVVKRMASTRLRGQEGRMAAKEGRLKLVAIKVVKATREAGTREVGKAKEVC
jgi:hypothetical protein